MLSQLRFCSVLPLSLAQFSTRELILKLGGVLNRCWGFEVRRRYSTPARHSFYTVEVLARNAFPAPQCALPCRGAQGCATADFHASAFRLTQQAAVCATTRVHSAVDTPPPKQNTNLGLWVCSSGPLLSRAASAVPGRLGIDMLSTGAGAVDACGHFPAAVKLTPHPKHTFFKDFCHSWGTCVLFWQPR